MHENNLESARLFSFDQVCLKSVEPLCLIEYMFRKCTATLFNRVCLESVKPLHCGGVRVEHVWLAYQFHQIYTCLESEQSFVLNAHAKKAYFYTYLIIECEC